MKGQLPFTRIIFDVKKGANKMMTNAEVIYQGIKFGMTVAASKGAKILVDEFVGQFTPENLDNTKRMCVEVANWGAATAFGTVCAKSVEDKLEKGKAYYDAAKKILNQIQEGKKKAEPVIETDENNNPVEIEEEDDEIPVEDLDFLK